MTMIVVAHASGSPGATTCALLAAAECGRPAMVVEAAVTGGTLTGGGLCWTPGVVTLASSFPGPLNRAALAEHAQMTALGVPAVVGAPSGPEAAACMARLVGPLSHWSPSGAGDVLLVDCGILSTGSVLWPLPLAADLTVLVLRQAPQAAGECAARVRHTHALAAALAAEGARVVAVVVVGENPYSPSEIASAVGVPVAAILPWEPAVPAIVAGGWPAGGRQSARFRRAAQTMAAALVALAEPAVDDVVGVA